MMFSSLKSRLINRRNVQKVLKCETDLDWMYTPLGPQTGGNFTAQTPAGVPRFC